MYLTLVPAYGRDYKSKKEVLADWNSDKDFLIADFSHPYDGKPMNRQDAETDMKGATINIRYKKLANICQIKVPV